MPFDNFMKTRLGKIVMIQMESRQQKSEKVKAETNQTDSSS